MNDEKDTIEKVSYPTLKKSKIDAHYTGPCSVCGKRLKSVEVSNHKAKCPDCDSETYVRYSD